MKIFFVLVTWGEGSIGRKGEAGLLPKVGFISQSRAELRPGV